MFRETGTVPEVTMIIDCHAHVARHLSGFWQPLRFGKVSDRGQIRQLLPPSFDPPASPPEALLGYMDQAGVDRTYLVQHYWYGDQNKTVLDALRQWPDRFRGFAYLGSMDQADAPDQLERLIEAGMTGLKVEVVSTRRLRPTFRFDGTPERKVWERLNQLKRPLVLDINDATPDDVHALHALIEELDNVRFLICHVGGAARDGWKERAMVARHPRAWVDISAVPMAFGMEQEYPYRQSQEVVRWAVETFGGDRVLWGTDYPPALNYGTYLQLLDFARRHCDFLTPDQRSALLGGNAEDFLSTSATNHPATP